MEETLKEILAELKAIRQLLEPRTVEVNTQIFADKVTSRLKNLGVADDKV